MLDIPEQSESLCSECLYLLGIHYIKFKRFKSKSLTTDEKIKKK